MKLINNKLNKIKETFLKIQNKNKFFKNKNIIKIICIFFIIIILYFFINKCQFKIALCTMGKKENLYVQEFINYYKNLGVNKIFIYDDNDLNSEKISDVVNPLIINYVKIYNNMKYNIKTQRSAFTDCYKKNKNKFKWFIMVDMDEFLVIVNGTLKKYLSNPVFDKCDFIKIHWIIPSDNDLIYYDNRSLFERFKGPYKKSHFIKSIIKGNINNLLYAVHSPSFSPKNNITCNNVGEIIKYNKLNFESVGKVNIKNAFIIHFKYKSTEEYINKYKRGYINFFTKKNINKVLNTKIIEYFRDNKITMEKINYLENKLNLNLDKYKKFKNHSFKLN